MITPRIRWIAGAVGFFAPTWLMGVDQLVRFADPQAHLPGGLLYVSIIVAAIVSGMLVLTSSLVWWRRFVFVLGVWGLLIVQVLLLGVWALVTGGLEGIQ